MSVRVMAAVFESDMPPTERLVMLALADHADDAGDCYPSVARIMSRTGLSERAVRGAFRKLSDAGALEITVGAGPAGCNRFRLKPSQYQSPPCTSCTPAPDAPLHVVHPPPAPDAPLHVVHPPPAPRAPEPSMNHQLETNVSNTRAKADQIRDRLARVLSPDVAEDFIAHRKAMRKPLTVRAAELIAKQLADSFEPDAAVNKSICNGWAGVFPEKSKGPGHERTAKSTERLRAFIGGAD
jgi:hypothetical protein